MVEVKIGEEIWEFTWEPGGLRILCGDRYIATIWHDQPYTEELLDTILKALCKVIKDKIEKEKPWRPPGGKPK